MIDFLNLHGPDAVVFARQMSWQTALLVGALGLLDWMAGRRLRSTLRCALWSLVVVKLLLPPSLEVPTGAGFWLGRWLAAPIVPPASARRAAVVEVMEPTLSRSDEPVAQIARPASTVLSLSGRLLLFWMVGAGLLGVGLLIRHRPVGRLRQEAEEAPAELQGHLQSAAAELGLRRLPRFQLSQAHHSPAICGLLRPVILLPAELAASLSPAGLRAVLLHELVHLRRHDLWVNLLQVVVQVLWWWNPLVWVANARIRTLREQAVDEAVLLATREDPVAYPSTLVQVARHCATRPILALSFLGIFESRRALHARVVRLLNSPVPVRADLGWSGWGSLLAAALIALPMGFSRRVEGADTAPAAGVGRASSPPPGVPPAASDTGTSPQPGLYRMDPVLARRYGLTASPSAPSGTNPTPQPYRMDPVLAARYGLLPQGQPAPSTSAGAAPAGLPGMDAPSSVPNGATILPVTIPAKGDRFLLDGTAVDAAHLKALLTDRARSQPNLALSLATDGEVPFARVNQALQAAAAAGITRIAMVNGAPSVAEPKSVASGPPAASNAVSSAAGVPLLTRQYRVEPNTFIEGLGAVLGRPLQPGPNGGSGTNQTRQLQVELREFFQAAGVTFPSPSGNSSAPAQDSKALFFNDRSGLLFVRATAGDLEIIEKAIQVLNAVPPQVLVEVKLVEMPGEGETGLPLELQSLRMAIEVPGSNLTAILSTSQSQALLRRLEERPGVDLLSAPRITTLSGRQARISITEPKPVPDPATGTTNTLEFGPILDVVPVVLADGVTIQLTVLASVSEYLAPDAQSPTGPRVRTSSLQASAAVWDGQTLVLGGDLVSGPLKAGANGRAELAGVPDPKPAKAHLRLLVLVTPTLIDPAGQRLHRPDSLPFNPNTVPPQPK